MSCPATGRTPTMCGARCGVDPGLIFKGPLYLMLRNSASGRDASRESLQICLPAGRRPVRPFKFCRGPIEYRRHFGQDTGSIQASFYRGSSTLWGLYFARVAVAWEGSLNFSMVRNRSFWGSGRPRGPRRPFQNVGGFAPHLLEWSPGPMGAHLPSGGPPFTTAPCRRADPSTGKTRKTQ